MPVQKRRQKGLQGSNFTLSLVVFKRYHGGKGDYIHRSGVLDSAVSLLRGWYHVQCCCLGAGSVYTMQPYTSLHCHFMQSHIRKAHVCV